MVNRREDHQLRDAISRIELLMSTLPDIPQVLELCLDLMAKLCNARCGCVFQVYDTIGVDIPWALLGCYEYQVSVDDPTDASEADIEQRISRPVSAVSVSVSLDRELAMSLMAGRYLSGDGAPKVPHPLVSGLPGEVENYFCIPLADPKHLYGVVYLYNLPSLLASDVEQRLRPLIAAAGCVLRLSKNSRDGIGGFERYAAIPWEQLIVKISRLADSVFNGIVLLDDQDIICHCNEAAAAMLSLPRRKVIGQSLFEFMEKGAPSVGRRILLAEQQDSRRYNSNAIWRGVSVTAANNKRRLVDVALSDVELKGQRYRCLVFEDISEQIRSATDYQQMMQRFHVLTSLAPIGIIQLDDQWSCTYANDTWCQYACMTPDEAMGLSWVQSFYHHDVDAFLESLRCDIAKSGRFEAEVRMQSPLGKVCWMLINASAVFDENGDIDGIILTCSDITQRVDTEQRLKEIAEKDMLTGLVNRECFNERLNRVLIAPEQYGRMALMFIDLDNFKQVNDTLGHDVGDALLIDVARRVHQVLRRADTISRIGGDEFTVILTHIDDPLAITALAEKLLFSMAQPFELNQRQVKIGCSIGIAIGGSGIDKDTLLKRADVALYQAKQGGRNQFRFYTPEMNLRVRLLKLVRDCLREKAGQGFRLVYQPQVDAATGDIIGVEVLTRWQHPEVGAVKADVFIKVIEESGLIEDFCEWQFTELFAQVAQWQHYCEAGLTIALNISANQFHNEHLPYLMFQHCQKYKLKPSFFVLELTETALVSNTELAAKVLKKLGNMGFGIALDDFGTGYSSLMHLRAMPLSCVKIDRSFIKDVVTDKGDGRIVEAILSLADTLGLSVVAEGVDNDQVKQWLIDRNCTHHQGFLFYKPLEKQQLEKQLMQQYRW